MLTLWQRHRVMRAIESSDLVQVGDMHLLVMPVDDDILEYLGMWGAEEVDNEDNHDREEVCEDDGAECDDEGAPGFVVVPPTMGRRASKRGRFR